MATEMVSEMRSVTRRASSNLPTSFVPNNATETSASLTKEEIEAKEWKYTGYRHYSQFIASDNDLLIFRSFGALNARVCLALQDEISILEQELATLDKASSDLGAPDIHNGSFRADVGSPRAKLLKGRIYLKLKEYNEFMFHYSHLKNRPPVPKKDSTSVSHWLENHQNAIQTEECAYIYHTSDLFCVVPKLKSPLRSLFEKSLLFRKFYPWRVKKKDIELEGHDPKLNSIYRISESTVLFHLSLLR
ncbi:hypothetical protein BGZ60DRAFT_419383 [Tricladium varicosporioides]|nr:hypothetical protein BGZ60DRAFT_419383 [Hymenoscyphus varicosporioides]